VVVVVADPFTPLFCRVLLEEKAVGID